MAPWATALDRSATPSLFNYATGGGLPAPSVSGQRSVQALPRSRGLRAWAWAPRRKPAAPSLPRSPIWAIAALLNLAAKHIAWKAKDKCRDLGSSRGAKAPCGTHAHGRPPAARGRVLVQLGHRGSWSGLDGLCHPCPGQGCARHAGCQINCVASQHWGGRARRVCRGSLYGPVLCSKAGQGWKHESNFPEMAPAWQGVPGWQ